MLNLIIALECEASPLIGKYSFKRDMRHHAFKVFRRHDMQLIISGVGKSNAVEATRYLADITETNDGTAWLNIGIGGHAKAEIGSIYLADEVTDMETMQSWRPRHNHQYNLPVMGVGTYSTPQDDYHGNLICEMEAAGVFHAAHQHGKTGDVHCLKVISDNAEHSTRKINKHFVKQLIGERLAEIDRIIQYLSASPK